MLAEPIERKTKLLAVFIQQHRRHRHFDKRKENAIGGGQCLVKKKYYQFSLFLRFKTRNEEKRGMIKESEKKITNRHLIY